VGSALDEQHVAATLGELARDHAAACSRADDDDVVRGLHAI
jgi:hypothetical protein